MAKERKRLLALTSALMLGTSQLVTLGVITHATPAAAESEYIGTIWGDPIVIDPYYDPNWTPTDPTGGPAASGGYTGGGGTGPSQTDPNPSKFAKDCADAALNNFTRPSSTAPAMDFTNAKSIDQLSKGAVPVSEAQQAWAKANPTVPWSSLSTTQQQVFMNQPTTFLFTSPPDETYLSEIGGKPAVLANSSMYAMWKTNVGDYGSYGASYKGLVYSIGLHTLAANLSEADAAEFVYLHELAHVASPGLTHAAIRNESSMFDASGNPQTTDGLALMALAAERSNTAGGLYNQSLTDLANKAAIKDPQNAHSSIAGC